ncbi:MAG: response regulator, partial [Pseudomonadota bacterium]
TLSVSDTGIGFEPEQSDDLFKRFSQGDASATRRYGGAGLGLAIVKKLIELMKGDIIATSTPGEGSVFTVELPLTRDRIADLAPTQIVEAEDLSTETSLEGLSVLAAEDNPMNQRVLELLMDQANARVDFVENGEDAVAAVQRTDYDIVLMDLQMPIMDGVAATRAIRAWETAENLPRLPVIAVSANATDVHVAQAEDAGCDAHIAKPIVQEALFEAIARLVRPGASVLAA